MLLLGINHFVMPDVYVRIIPDFISAKEEAVYISGVAEIIAALMTMFPRTRRTGGFLLIAVLVAVFPANVHMALHPERYPSLPEAGLYARLPLQALFIYWAYLVATKPEPD
jgi:uncharacterized membrane protein